MFLVLVVVVVGLGFIGSFAFSFNLFGNFTRGVKTERVDITFQGVERHYIVAHPRRVKGTPQILVMLHGGGFSDRAMQSRTGADGLVGKSNFVIYPEATDGIKVIPGTQGLWNAGDCCGEAAENGVDDVAFIEAVVDQVRAEYGISTSKFYVAGLSNGGMMAYKLACEIPERLNGVASVAGTIAEPNCQPADTVPLLHIHALDDQAVLYDGGCGPDCTSGHDHQSVADAVDFWAAEAGCGDATKVTYDKSGGSCVTYRGCDAPVSLCTLNSGGHEWPGTDSPTGFDATNMIWQYFK